VLLCLAVLLSGTVYGEVGGDGVQAFVVVRSALLDGDLDLANDYAGLGASVVSTGGQATSHLPVGLALLWAPAFLAAHVAARIAAALGADVTADGFSVTYRSAVTAATYAYGVLALVLIESELRRHFTRAVAILATLGVWFATPLHFYMTANPAMAHGVSVFAATLFVVAWLRVRADPSATPRAWAVVGALGGLMTLVRLQDAVLLALPVLDLLWGRAPGTFRRLTAFAAAAFALGLVQLAVWLRLYGRGFVSTVLTVNLVGGTPPHVLDVLFSARHGLFYWTPLYVVCVLGWAAWARLEPRPAALTVIGFLAAVLVNASIQDWWGSEAFGQRRLLGLTPLFALGLAAALGVLGRATRVLAGAAIVVLALWTLSFEGIYNSAVVAPRDQAITYSRLAAAQGDALRRDVVRLDGHVPDRVWRIAYDVSGGAWVEGHEGSPARIDIGAEPPAMPFLVGRGWYDAETEGGITLRRSRGPGSWLRVPIRDRADSVAVVRLRPELPDVPLGVTFEVNRQPVGMADVAPGWSDYSFAIPKAVLRVGLNDVGLVYSTTPRAARPGAPGRNAAVAVDWITIAPR